MASSSNFFSNSEMNSQILYVCYMAELPFWLLKPWNEKNYVKKAPPKKPLHLSFPFFSGKIVNKKQYYICGEIAEIIIPIKVFRYACLLIYYNISPFNLNIWLMRSPLLKVNISRLSEI